MTRPGAARTEVALLAAGLIVLVLGALLVGGDNVPAVERSVFRAVNDLPDFLDGPVWVVMQLGSSLAIAAVTLGSLAWRRYRLALALAVAGLTVDLLDPVVKTIVGRPRPPLLLAHVHLRGALPTGNGYPSGHAAVAFALATIAWLWFGPRFRWVPVGAALVVCFARVYVGVHFPLDVVGGAALGIAGGALFGLVLSVRRDGASDRAARREGPAAPA